MHDWVSRIRIFLLVAGIVTGHLFIAGMGPNTRDALPNESLERAVHQNVATILLARRGARVVDIKRDVAWVNPPDGQMTLTGSMAPQTFVALAIPPNSQTRDLYRLEAKVTPHGHLYDDAWIVNLTQSDSADDDSLTVHGNKVATAVTYNKALTAVEIRDLAGEDINRSGVTDWGRIQLAGNSITNLEQTGTSRGLELDHFVVESPNAPSRVMLQFQGDSLMVGTEDGKKGLCKIDLSTKTMIGPLKLSHLATPRKMKMKFLNWLADRGRGFADQGLGPQWAGDGIELLKEFYFKAGEAKAQIEEATVKPEEITEEAEEVVEEAIRKAKLATENSSRPWPPAPLDPMLVERLKGEGIWVPVGPDRVQHQPNAPVPFYQTYVRPDAKYSRKRVHVVVWDPAQVSLNVRAGTREPVPQTGRRGDGEIPRKKGVIDRVVAAHNGGFQTSHIWYGMMVDRRVMLRPRGLGATAGSWADGRTAFGTWKPGAPIPEDLTGYRQNLPPLVEDGVFNPYRRRTWGWSRNVAGVKEGRTTRSALCYTYDGYVMYFYTEFANTKGLTSAVMHCHCRYAVHLDMNPGHTGFEFYRQARKDETSLDPDKTKALGGVTLVGDTLHKVVRHMRAPVRYLGTDYRDFFYMTLRHVVPGPDLGENPWQVKGLPKNAEFPPRYATTTLLGGKARVVQLDMRGLSVKLHAPKSAKEITTKDLTMSIPLGLNEGPERMKIGDVTLSGYSITEAQQNRVDSAVIFGKDQHGYVFLISLENASVAEAYKKLRTRHIVESIWQKSDAQSNVNLYQSAENAELLEVPLGSEEGKLITQPTNKTPRLFFYSETRDSAVVRLFPDMKPKKRK